MGIIIPIQRFNKDAFSQTSQLIIYCCAHKEITDNAISVGTALAEKLMGCEPNQRTSCIEALFEQVLSPLADGVVIKDYDVLFNPAYNVDVVQILTIVRKTKPFCAVWPGKYKNSKLFYAEDGYSDFKSFDIDKYHVVCVVKEDNNEIF